MGRKTEYEAGVLDVRSITRVFHRIILSLYHISTLYGSRFSPFWKVFVLKFHLGDLIVNKLQHVDLNLTFERDHGFGCFHCDQRSHFSILPLITPKLFSKV